MENRYYLVKENSDLFIKDSLGKHPIQNNLQLHALLKKIFNEDFDKDSFKIEISQKAFSFIFSILLKGMFKLGKGGSVAERLMDVENRLEAFLNNTEPNTYYLSFSRAKDLYRIHNKRPRKYRCENGEITWQARGENIPKYKSEREFTDAYRYILENHNLALSTYIKLSRLEYDTILNLIKRNG